jgi:hypothetical protein
MVPSHCHIGLQSLNLENGDKIFGRIHKTNIARMNCKDILRREVALCIHSYLKFQLGDGRLLQVF